MVEVPALTILRLRGHNVMLDADLAGLYGVSTKALNQAVRRNVERFPDDFMFQLTTDEAVRLRSQFVTLKEPRGRHRKYLPYTFCDAQSAEVFDAIKELMTPSIPARKRIGFSPKSL